MKQQKQVLANIRNMYNCLCYFEKQPFPALCIDTFLTLSYDMLQLQTDPENTDYAMEHGATRNFQAEKLVEEAEKRVQQEREEEELNNPMKVSVQR